MLKQSSIAQAFGKAAGSYDQSAALQRDVGTRLLQTLPPDVLQAKNLGNTALWLDLGCGTGYFSHRVAAEYAEDVLSIDIAAQMLMQTRSRCQIFCGVNCVQGCAENIPLKSGSVDIVFSNFVFQWSDDLAGIISECLRVLKPGGQLVFSMPGEATLKELRSSWQQVDSFDHVNTFYSKGELEVLLSDTLGFAELINVVSVSKYYRTTKYLSLKALLVDLKNIGANRVRGKQKKGLLGKAQYKILHDAYEYYRLDDGFLPATYEILNVQLQKPV
ncbi:MAG: malonyl-ACP O-methyltransferase BioC [Gammaproteobacteria bacterium]|nr:malonyl-ACP O-methyltransferase BioC [Gammaproteobacteria bacterium]